MCDFDQLERGSKADQVDRWLKRYRGLRAKEHELQSTIDATKAEYDGVRGIDYSRDNVQTTATDDGTMLLVIHLADVLEDLERVHADAVRRENEMEAAIDALPDPMHSAILRAHYINGKRWEDVCATDATRTTYRTMMRWRKAALESLYDLDLMPPTERLPRIPAL